MPRSLYSSKLYKHAPKQKYPESRFMKVLHGVSTPLYITAGLLDEAANRRAGKMPTPYSTVLRESAANLIPWLSDVRRRKTYGSIIENKAVAFGFDIFGDPITYIPSSWLVKGWKGVGFLAHGAISKPGRFALEAADKALGTELVRSVEKITDSVARMVIPHADLKKLAGKEILDMKIQSYRDIEKFGRDLEKKVIEGLGGDKLDYHSKAFVFDLIERRPFIKDQKFTQEQILKMVEDPEYQRFVADIRKMTPEQYRFYNRSVKMRDFLEEEKQRALLVSKERMAGFREKFGIGYLPHRRGY